MCIIVKAMAIDLPGAMTSSETKHTSTNCRHIMESQQLYVWVHYETALSMVVQMTNYHWAVNRLCVHCHAFKVSPQMYT